MIQKDQTRQDQARKSICNYLFISWYDGFVEEEHWGILYCLVVCNS